MNATMQREHALERANEIRTARAELKRSIRQGDGKVSELLKEPIPEWLRSETIGRFLKYTPRLGEKRVMGILASIPLGYHRTLGNLTAREKGMVILRLKERKRIDA